MQQAVGERRQREERQATVREKIAETITRFAGSMLFVYIHLVIFGFWIIANLGWIALVLAMWASVEAIFLSTFVPISQNRCRQRPTSGPTSTSATARRRIGQSRR